MLQSKYYAAIIAAEAADKPVAPGFDLKSLAKGTLSERVVQFGLDRSTSWLGALRSFWPRLRIGKLLLVTRYDDVREILDSQDVFEVPFGREMMTLAGGENFVLGMQDGDLYRHYHRALEKAFSEAFSRDTADAAIGPHVKPLAEAFVAHCGGTIDVIRDLVIPTGTNVVRELYGVDVLDDNAFAHWSISCSMLLFADPQGSPETRVLARTGALYLGRAIDDAIAAARAGRKSPATIVRRLVDQRNDDGTPALGDAAIRALLFGMITGFVPTNALAAGNLIEMLFSRPDVLRAAREAARADDDRRLERILFEALRFRSPLNPGVMRYANADVTIGAKRGRAYRIAAGTTILVSTQSAMFDRRRFKDAGLFRPDREQAREMLFGHGIHWCIGAEIARVHITQALKPLLKTRNLKPASGKVRVGPFTIERPVQFEAETGGATQSLITVLKRLDGVPESEIRRTRREIEKLGNPANPGLRDAIAAAGCVHFMSINVLPSKDTFEDQPDASGNPNPEPAFLIVEMSVDGDPRQAIDKLVDSAGPLLLPAFRCCDLVDTGALAHLLKTSMIRLAWNGTGAYGLGFCGTPGLSVQRIHAEEALEEKARQVLARYMASGHRPTSRPLETLALVRDELRRQGEHWCFLRQPVAHHRDPVPLTTLSLLSVVPRGAIQLALSALAVGTLAIYFGALWSPDDGQLWWGPVRGAMKILVALVAAGVLGAAVAASAGGLLAYLLRKLETTDEACDFEHDATAAQDILARENAHGHVQNHMLAVSRLKAGWLRSLALRFVYRGIVALAGNFRPGFLVDIGTIHFARWVKLPGTNRLLFFSNYDGSWESYLEDFITKSHQGLTGVWSNTKDFPRASWLINDGATDGARFKRWARRQQRPTQFWYSAYPALTTNRIRTNASIRFGIAAANCNSDAKAWLEQFGTLPQPEVSLEMDEIQSLMFDGFGGLERSVCLLLSFEGGTAKCREWLGRITDQLSYGDKKDRQVARILALSPSGLNALGLGRSVATPDGGEPPSGLDSFPHAFTMGMTNQHRARVLGDTGRMVWGAAEEIDVVLLLYAETPELLDAEVSQWTGSFPGHVVRSIRTGLKTKPEVRGRAMAEYVRPPRSKHVYEPFGFADGLSQPIIRGTSRYYRKDIDPMHVVNAGELILGYPDNRGFFPPTPQVVAGEDPRNHLASTPKGLPERWPAHATSASPSAQSRDLGRNGSFLVIRQIQQHVGAFWDYVEAQSGRTGIAAETIAAKMVGRWRNGSPLSRNPDGPSQRLDNDFKYGEEDPQGRNCPFGAHIRRAMPRDRRNAASQVEIDITNRHRILRAGRPYWASADDEDDHPHGLLFMVLNADIERQFEFVQQTWINAPDFECLRNDMDSIAATPGNYPASSRPEFTIPGGAGTVTLSSIKPFTRVIGGGYYFMPGRRTLRFLSD